MRTCRWWSWTSLLAQAVMLAASAGSASAGYFFTEEGLVANGRRLLKTPSGQALQDLFVMAQPAGTAKIESSVYYTENS
ncbi:hypothetical protein ABBQ32_007744 [Trebouxia sp. C0010 RCD-2024]